MLECHWQLGQALRLVGVLAGRKLSQYFNNNNAGGGSGCQSFNNNNGRKMLQAFNNNNAGGDSGCQYFNNNNGANSPSETTCPL